MVRFLLLFTFIFCSLTSFAQYPIQGVTVGKNNSPLIGTNVLLLKLSDSTLIKGTTADLQGKFLLNYVSTGKYILKIKFIGYKDYFTNVEIADKPVDLGTITMKEAVANLKGVTIEEQAPASKELGDTTEFNAAAFKTNPDANAEDLVMKLPGISTTKKGKLQAQGEDVKQVLVDGKPFFGDDPEAVLKHLPAEIISKIQVFDKKSDQALFTGFDDGSDSKTLNIITKPEFQNAHFGKVFGGYGSGDNLSDDKYKVGGNLNFFSSERRLSLLGLSNNVNEQNFTTEDLLGVIGSGSSAARSRAGKSKSHKSSSSGSSNSGSGNNANDFLVDTKNGISKTTSAGINFVDSWGYHADTSGVSSSKADLAGSYFFNQSDNTTIGSLFRRYILPNDTGLTYSENNNNNSKNINHRLHLRLDYKFDSLNSVLFQPRLSVQHNEGNSDVNGQNFSHDSLLSGSHSFNTTMYDAMNFTSSILFRHKFLKKGRTVSLNLTPGYNKSSGTSFLNSLNINKVDTFVIITPFLNQHSNLDKNGVNGGANLIYTEPIGEKNLVQLRYAVAFNDNNSEKKTYNLDSLSNEYDRIDSLTSNVFKSHYYSQQAGAGIKRNTAKYEFSVGASYHFAQLINDQQFPDTTQLTKRFENVLPHASFQYRFTKNENLRIYLRKNNNAPSIEQLQNVLNNSNPLQLTIGNPDLRQDDEYNFVARYSASNPAKSTTFFAMTGGSYVNNYIGNRTIIATSSTFINTPYINNLKLRRGRSLTMPANLNDYFNIHSFLTYGFPIKLVKSNLHFHLGASYTRTPGLINDSLNYSITPSYNFSAVLSSNVSEKLDFLFSSVSSRNDVQNTIQRQLNSRYFNQETKFKIVWQFWKTFVLQTDIHHEYNQGLSNGYNQNVLLWNGALAYKFLNNNSGDIRIYVFDILRQNKNIDRNITDTYIEDTQNEVLQQYFMLIFTYKINKYKKI